VAAVLAAHVLGAAQARDRLVLAAVGTRGDQLVAAQAVDADEAPRELGGPKPWLAAARAVRAVEGSLRRVPRLCIAEAALDPFGHSVEGTERSDRLAGQGVTAEEIGRTHRLFARWLNDIEAQDTVAADQEQPIAVRDDPARH
jgi:hypothetical protein